MEALFLLLLILLVAYSWRSGYRAGKREGHD
jgi:hypothetical protein